MDNFTLLNKETYDVIPNDKYIIIENKIAKIISNLNKKGYYVEYYLLASLTKPFFLACILHSLIENNAIDTNKWNIKDNLKYYDTENTTILFKEKYEFKNLPKGFKLEDKNLTYTLSILKDNTDVSINSLEDFDISIKTLVELDHELTDSLKELERWSEDI